MIRIIILEAGGLKDCLGSVTLVEMNISCSSEVDASNKNNIS